MEIEAINKAIYLKAFEAITLGYEPYRRFVEGLSLPYTFGTPSAYANLFLMLLLELSKSDPQEVEKLSNLEQITAFKGKRILEVGCNVGYLMKILADLGAECYGIDIEDFSSILNQQHIQFAKIDLLANNHYTPTSIFPDASFELFDVAISRALLEKQITTQNEAIGLIQRLSKLSHFQIHEITVSSECNISTPQLVKAGYNARQYLGALGAFNPVIYVVEEYKPKQTIS